MTHKPIFLMFAITSLLNPEYVKREKYSLFRSHPKGLCSSANYLLNNEASLIVDGELAPLDPPPPHSPSSGLLCPSLS